MRWCLGAIITHYLAASLHASKEDVKLIVYSYALNKLCGTGCYKSNWQRLLIHMQLHVQLWSNHCELPRPYKGVAEQICHVETVSSLNEASG